MDTSKPSLGGQGFTLVVVVEVVRRFARCPKIFVEYRTTHTHKGIASKVPATATIVHSSSVLSVFPLLMLILLRVSKNCQEGWAEEWC